MVFYRGLVTAGNDQDRVKPAGYRLLHSILDQRLVHERQHLLWR